MYSALAGACKESITRTGKKRKTGQRDDGLEQGPGAAGRERSVRDMWIHEAVKKALENNQCITLPEFLGTSKIKPTDEPGRCIVMGADGSRPSKYGWQPSAADLIRNDWSVEK